MEATYDPDADAAYVYIQPSAALESGCAVRTRIADDGAILDYDRDGHLIGYELLSARFGGLDVYQSVPVAARRLVAQAIEIAVAAGRYCKISE